MADAVQTLDHDPDAPNTVALDSSAPVSSVQVIEPTTSHDENISVEETASAPHRESIDASEQEDNIQPLADTAVEDSHATFNEDGALDANSQRLPQNPHTDNRQALTHGSPPSPNRQTLTSDVGGDRRQALPTTAMSPRAFEPAPKREAEVVLTRFFETWQAAAANESETVRRKAGFPTEIPPTIHRQRVVDFSSLNIYLEYDHENEESTETQTESNRNGRVKRDYDYKLRACLDILKRQQEVVNSKLERLQGKK